MWVPNSEWYNGLLEISCVHCIVDDDQVIKLCIYQLDIIDNRYRTNTYIYYASEKAHKFTNSVCPSDKRLGD